MRVAAVLSCLIVACSTPSTTDDAGSADDSAPPDDAGHDAGPPLPDAGTGTTTIGPTDRPARLVAPNGPITSPSPLLVLLHGYGATGAVQDAYLGVSRAAATRGLYVLLPDGTLDSGGMRFWNAPGCCDFAHTGVDDVAYLTGLVHEAIAARPIDPSRVYFFGHSNGGFMSYHLACTSSDEIAAIAVLAGSDVAMATDCTPTRPLSVLHLHGTADTTVPYAGGNVGLGPFPGAVEVTQRWAMRAGCDATPTMDAAIDMESTLPGAETMPSTYTGCDTGLDVRLLSIGGGGHIPSFTSGVIGTQVLDWLLMHHL
jgi:polyhydroxybutyrate depolymerase